MLNPIGSEKIQNVDEKLARIKQMAGINETTEATPLIGKLQTIIHEAVASNGEEYAIIQENKYVYIKKKNDDGVYDYIGGLQNLQEHSYKGYGEAYKQLNFLFQQINEQVGHKESVDMYKKKV